MAVISRNDSTNKPDSVQRWKVDSAEPWDDQGLNRISSRRDMPRLDTPPYGRSPVTGGSCPQHLAQDRQVEVEVRSVHLSSQPLTTVKLSLASLFVSRRAFAPKPASITMPLQQTYCTRSSIGQQQKRRRRVFPRRRLTCRFNSLHDRLKSPSHAPGRLSLE